MNEKIFCLYKITNLINNKIYFGETSNLKKRWNAHVSLSKDTTGKKKYAIHKAIIKYNLQNFKFEVIEQRNSKEEIRNLETEYIKKFKTLIPNGYNETLNSIVINSNYKKKTKLSKTKALSVIKEYVNTETSARLLSKKFNLVKSCIINILNLRNGYEIKISKKLNIKLKEKLQKHKPQIR